MTNSLNRTSVERLVSTILVGILIALVVWGISLIKEYEHRLTELETNFKNCVDCSKKVQEIGGVKVNTYTGTSINEKTGEIDLEVNIDILSEQCRWECGSARNILQGGKPINFDEVMKEYVSNDQILNIKGLICVGAASSEGAITNEENRANDRMEYLINLVKNYITNDTIPIYGLNIGKFLENRVSKCSDQTIDQRRIIIFKIIKKDENMTEAILERKLRRILLEKSSNTDLNFPIDIRKYSKFKNNETMLTVGRNLN